MTWFILLAVVFVAADLLVLRKNRCRSALAVIASDRIALILALVWWVYATGVSVADGGDLAGGLAFGLLTAAMVGTAAAAVRRQLSARKHRTVDSH